MITKIENIIDYFISGIKDKDSLKIGIEHEKFLFNINSNKRADYTVVLEMFKQLYEFGWKPIYENENIILIKY